MGWGKEDQERQDEIDSVVAECTLMLQQKLETAEQAIRESQEQEPYGTIQDKGMDKPMPLYTKPVIIPQSAEQLHIKELRECLLKYQRAGVGNSIDLRTHHEAYLLGDKAIAKQPDTRALDKALLEAEIKALDTAYKTCVPYSVEFSHMTNDRKAKLAELNKD